MLQDNQKEALAALIQRRVSVPKLKNDKPELDESNVPILEQKDIKVDAAEVHEYKLNGSALGVVLTDGYKARVTLTAAQLKKLTAALGDTHAAADQESAEQEPKE